MTEDESEAGLRPVLNNIIFLKHSVWFIFNFWTKTKNCHLCWRYTLAVFDLLLGMVRWKSSKDFLYHLYLRWVGNLLWNSKIVSYNLDILNVFRLFLWTWHWDLPPAFNNVFFLCEIGIKELFSLQADDNIFGLKSDLITNVSEYQQFSNASHIFLYTTYAWEYIKWQNDNPLIKKYIYCFYSQNTYNTIAEQFVLKHFNYI